MNNFFSPQKKLVLGSAQKNIQPGTNLEEGYIPKQGAGAKTCLTVGLAKSK
jgi:hypothetical protein